ncbi:hypothetical protein F3Y22_tig00112344pilonHSYRG00077 [Hibiscus syriacus]|uniref:BZIP domain-containing protein n=1 Tax=Hibiscus syriacus TaxID=106335 RepID=A0A6A2Y982_HIBSY|nr:hypothetical protein F3Y22_tig00112344pilonHSYRG00077 [Hibiscus syriacus]
MSPILSEIFLSGLMINSTSIRRTQLVQSFSVVFLYCGTSSGSLTTNSGSEGDLQALMNERKRKRMISNRESARRSRMRKKKHLDDLQAQVTQLRNDNQQILTQLDITTQRYLNVETQNSVLRAQANELGHRLQSLNEIIGFINGGGTNSDADGFGFTESADSFFNPLNHLNQPIMASADNVFEY